MSSTNNSQKSRFPYYSTAPSDTIDATQGASQIYRYSHHEEKEFTAQPYVNAPPFRRHGFLYTPTPAEGMHPGCLSTTQPRFPSHFPASHPSSNIHLYPSLQNDAHFQPFNLADPSLSVHASAVSVAFKDVRAPSIEQPGSHPTYCPMPPSYKQHSDADYDFNQWPRCSLEFPPNEYTSFLPMADLLSDVAGDAEDITAAEWDSASSPSSSSALDTVGDEEHLGIECRWGGGCGIRVTNAKASKINAHLRRYHFQGPTALETRWSRRFRGLCEWEGCTSSHNMLYYSFGKHVATVHLGSTAAICTYGDCRGVFTRGDAMARHVKKKHGT